MTNPPQPQGASPLGVGAISGQAPTPAGWYPDPAGFPRSRWWDGAQWTMHYNRPFDAPVLATASTPGASIVEPVAVTSVNSVYNAWIWLVVVAPYAALPFLFGLGPLMRASALDAAGTPLSTDAQLATLLSPSVIAFVVVGFLAPWATIYFSYRDWRWLEDEGLPRPFHWAWGFLTLSGYPVYAIGRAIVTRRRTGAGVWVIWATIGMFALSIIVSIAWSLSVLSSLIA